MSEDVSGGRLHIDAYVDTTGISRGLQARIDRETKAIRAKIRAELDTRGLAASAKKAAAEASQSVKVKLKADLDSRGLITQTKAAAAAASKAATVKVRTKLDKTALAQVRASIEDATQDVKVQVQAEADAAKAELDDIQVRADRLANHNVDISVAVSGIDAVKTLDELDALTKARREAEIRVKANTDEAIAEIEALRAAESRKGIDIPVNVGGGGGGGGGLSALGSQIMGLSKIPAMVGGIYTLGVAAVQAAGGLFSMGAAAAQSVGVLAVLPGLAVAAAQGLGALFLGFHGVGKAVAALAQADQQGATTAQQTAKAQVDAAHQIAEARYNLAQAQHQAADDAKASSRAISDAEWNLARAQEAAKSAQENLNAAREQARQDIIDLNRELKDSILTEKEAANAIVKAREHLQDVKWDKSATAQEKRDAQLALQEAEAQFRDARNRRKDLQKADDDARKKGVKNADVVVAARHQVRDSIHAEKQAEQALALARHSAADQARADAHSISEAQYALKQALDAGTEAATAQSAATTALSAAMDGLSPAGQRFARFIFGLKPKWDAVRNSVQEALLPPIEEGIKKGLPLLETFRKGLTGTARRIGAAIRDAGGAAGKKGFNADVSGVMKENNRATTRFLHAAGNLFQTLKDIAVVAGPTLLRPFSKWVDKVSDGWRKSVHANRENGKMADFFVKARKRASQLADILGNVVGAVVGMGHAAAGPGGDLLKMLDDTTQKWQDFTESDDGQKKMKAFFDAAKPVTKEIGKLLANLAEFLTKASEGGGTPLLGLLKGLNWFLDGVNKAMGHKGFAQLVSGIMQVAGVAGAIGIVVGGLTKMVAPIGKLAKAGKSAGGFMKSLAGHFRGAKDAIDDELPADKKKKDALDDVGGAGEGAGKKLRAKFVDGVKRAKDAAIDAAGSLRKRLVSGLKAAGSAAVDSGKKLGTKLASGAKAAAAMGARGVKAFVQFSKQILLSGARAVVAAARIVIQTGAMLAQRAAAILVTAATKAWAAAQWLINAAMEANPLGLIVGLLVLLAIGLYEAWKHSETFRKIVTAAFDKVKEVAEKVFGWLTGAASNALGFIKKHWKTLLVILTGPVGLAFLFIKRHWGKIKSLFSDALHWVGGFFKDHWKTILLTVLLGPFGLIIDQVHKHWDTIQGWFSKAVDWVKSVFANDWKLIKKYILDPLMDALDHVRDLFGPNGPFRTAFQKGVDAIGKIWHGLEALARQPIEFIVNTVYNKGIRTVVNAIPGIDDLPELSFARGGTLPGVLPGYTPGKDVHRFVSPSGGVLNLSGGEGILRPEIVKQLGPKAIDFLNAAARKGAGALRAALGMEVPVDHSHARGGILGRLGSTLNYWMGGVLPLPGATSIAQHDVSQYPWATWAGDLNWPGYSDYGKPIKAWKAGYSSPFDYGSDTSYGRGQVLQTSGGGSQLYAHMSRVVTALAGKMVKAGQTIGYVGDYGNTGTPPTSHLHFEIRGGSANLGDATGGEDTGGGGGGPLGFLTKFKDAISKVKDFASHVKGWFTELKNMGGWGPMLQKSVSSSLSGMRDWINDKIPGPGPFPNIFDRGGALHPGRTMAYNGTGKIETVFTNENMVDITDRLAKLSTNLITLSEQRGDGAALPALVGELNLHAEPGQMPSLLGEAEFHLRRIRQGGVHAKRT